MNVAIGIPMFGNTLTISTTPLPHHSSINNLIESLPGGHGFTSFIPSELATIFANVGLENFTLIVNEEPKVTFLGLSIDTLQPWTIIQDDLILEELCLQLQVIEPTGMNWERVFITAKADFLPHIFNGTFDFIIGLQKQTTWEISTISGAYHGSVNLGNIVAGLLNSHDSVPAALRDIEFSNFGVNATRSSQGAPFTYSFYGSVETAFPILGTQLTTQLDLVVAKTPTSHTIHLAGSLVIGEQAFALILDLGTAESKLTANWKAQNETHLEFEDLATAFNLKVPDIPEGLDLALESASLIYDFSDDILVIEAASANYGNAVFVAFKNTTTTKWQFYFGLSVGKPINLSNLPVVNKILSDKEKIEVQNLQILIASAPLDPKNPADKKEIDTINNLVDSGYPSIPAQGLPSTIALSAQFDFGGFTIPLSISTPKKTPTQSGTEVAATLPAGGGTSVGSGSGSSMQVRFLHQHRRQMGRLGSIFKRISVLSISKKSGSNMRMVSFGF